jgi:hypothetical protein
VTIIITAVLAYFFKDFLFALLVRFPLFFIGFLVITYMICGSDVFPAAFVGAIIFAFLAAFF